MRLEINLKNNYDYFEGFDDEGQRDAILNRIMFF
jgi:hypothetical protein